MFCCDTGFDNNTILTNGSCVSTVLIRTVGGYLFDVAIASGWVYQWIAIPWSTSRICSPCSGTGSSTFTLELRYMPMSRMYHSGSNTCPCYTASTYQREFTGTGDRPLRVSSGKRGSRSWVCIIHDNVIPTSTGDRKVCRHQSIRSRVDYGTARHPTNNSVLTSSWTLQRPVRITWGRSSPTTTLPRPRGGAR